MPSASFDARRYQSGPRREVLLVTTRPGEAASTMAPLAAAYLGAAARAAGHRVRVLNLAGDEDPRAVARDRIAPAGPELVGMSCYLGNLDFCLALAEAVKAVLPRVHVALGGPQVNGSPELCLRSPHVDSLCLGEGEVTLCELLDVLGEPEGLARVRGIWFRDAEGRHVRNPPRPLVRDLDSLPLPALDLYERDFWMTRFKGRAVGPIFGARGCAFDCTFCATKVTWGRSMRFHSPARILQEMDRLRQDYGIDTFGFYDATFAMRRERVLELCALIARHPHKPAGWFCETRAETVDPELLAAMKKAGCLLISYGVETGNERLLKEIKKGCTMDDYRRAIAMTREAGIEVGAYFIIGFPGETPEETANTLRFASELAPDRSGINIAVPYCGTELHEQALRTGALEEGFTHEDLARRQSIWVPEGRTKEELLKWLEAGRKFLG